MTHLRRSVLFMPGDSLRKITKATEIDVDCVVMDLEDGVAANRKGDARSVTLDACLTLPFDGREKLVRINPPQSGLSQQDLDATILGRPDGYVIPKVESAQDLQKIAAYLDDAERQHDWPLGQIRLLAIIESARGVLFLREISASTPRLCALMFGAEDLASNINALRTPEATEVLYARSAVVIAAAAYELDAIDMLHIDFNDDEGLRHSTLFGRQLGYTGKMAIHPRQIPIIHDALAPSQQAIDDATRLIEAHHAHQQSGTGAFAFHGKMIDMPLIRSAQQILRRAQPRKTP